MQYYKLYIYQILGFMLTNCVPWSYNQGNILMTSFQDPHVDIKRCLLSALIQNRVHTTDGVRLCDLNCTTLYEQESFDLK